jgi:DNA-binding MarR family transcriptional regulator
MGDNGSAIQGASCFPTKHDLSTSRFGPYSGWLGYCSAITEAGEFPGFIRRPHLNRNLPLPKLRPPSGSEFSELEESIGYMVRNAHRAYDRVLGEALSRHQILTGQWSLLRVLWDEDNLSQIEVAKRMKIERASLTIMLNTVEKAGLITRRVDAGDRRKQLISLTRKGRAYQKLLVPLGMRVNEAALAGLSKREVSTLRSLLQRVTDNLEGRGA